jgi:hypothetical protein
MDLDAIFARPDEVPRFAKTPGMRSVISFNILGFTEHSGPDVRPPFDFRLGPDDENQCRFLCSALISLGK